MNRETAAELMARLQSDPEWVRQHAERMARHEAKIEQIRKEIEPEEAALLADLAIAEVKVRMNPRLQLTLLPEARPGKVPVAVRSIND